MPGKYHTSTDWAYTTDQTYKTTAGPKFIPMPGQTFRSNTSQTQAQESREARYRPPPRNGPGYNESLKFKDYNDFQRKEAHYYNKINAQMSRGDYYTENNRKLHAKELCEDASIAMEYDNYDRALDMLTKALQLDANVEYYGNRAALHFKLQHYESALNDAKQALLIDSNFIKGHLLAAECYDHLKDIPAAMECYQAALAVKPKNKKASKGLAKLREKLAHMQKEKEREEKEEKERQRQAKEKRMAREETDPYEILGIRPFASYREITLAYRKKAKQYHPDKHPGASKEERSALEEEFKKISAAYKKLVYQE